MSLHGLLKTQIRPEKDSDELEDSYESDVDDYPEQDRDVAFNPTQSHGEVEHLHDSDDSDKDSSVSAGDELPDAHEDLLANVSFGALASAQAALGQKRKRPALNSATRRSPSPFHEAQERREGKKSASRTTARASQHAPTELSSKKAVSRKRSIVHVPVSNARDPRFSSLSGWVDERRVERDYAFLQDYRQSELADLKKELREAAARGETDRKASLQRQVRAMEDRERARSKVQAEREVLRAHRQRERERVREGKQPYYLKKSAVKKQLLEQQFAELGPKKAEKLMERRRRKQAAKERTQMPRSRRDRGEGSSG